MGNKKPWDERRIQLQKLLRQMREEAGLKQSELAERIGSTDQSFVSRFERGERRLDLIELSDICGACSQSIGAFANRFEAAILPPVKGTKR